MRKTASYLSRLFAVIAVTLAMATSGFAHRVAAHEMDPALIAFVQAGGSLNELCGDLTDTQHNDGQLCEACRLYASISVPPVAFSVAAILNGRMIALTAAAVDIPITAVIDQSRPVRAPPVV